MHSVLRALTVSALVVGVTLTPSPAAAQAHGGGGFHGGGGGFRGGGEFHGGFRGGDHDGFRGGYGGHRGYGGGFGFGGYGCCYGGYYGGFGFGDALFGAAIIAGTAAVIASEPTYYQTYPPPYPVYAPPVVLAPPVYGYAPPPPAEPAYRPVDPVEQCSRAAVGEAAARGDAGHVTKIDRVDAYPNGANVTGVLEVRRADRHGALENARFTCTAAYGQVTAFRFG